jgi:signal transduction histidine kinase
MNPLRSVGARLGLALAVVVAAALALVDVIVVPSLQQNLVHAKITQLRNALPGIRRQIATTNLANLDLVLQDAAASANARAVVFQQLDTESLLVAGDSNGVSPSELTEDPIALRASRSFGRASGTVDRGDDRFAEAAEPVATGYILLLSASLHDSLANVREVRHRLLLAGIVALAASLAVGYGAATIFARRLRRLERAADRIAGGDFGEPVVDHGADEVGELALAFDRMRVRLAGLERARRAFIANASHELRTPLFSLGGFVELMQDEDLDPATQREFLETMREQIARLTKLATDLLDLSRVDAGRLHVESAPVDLGLLAHTLADEFRAVALSTEHTVEVVDRSAPAALADEERVLQIGRVLVENALLHTPAGSTVVLSTARRDAWALLTVEDDGPGIPAKDRPHVFERFYRAESTTASGSGLGLAIARELAGLMGGTVELHATPGRTIFALVLPAAADAPLPPSPADFHVETAAR